MTFTQLFQVASFLCGGWAVALLLVSFPSVQRHVFYAHKLPIWWRQKLDQPETFGFLPNQVFPFSIPTPDGEKLYMWLVLPLKACLAHEHALTKRITKGSNINNDHLSLRLIRDDPHRKLVIYFHGNASAVGSTRRTEAYRSVSAGDSEHLYVLTFDYRGFGRSTGTPTERGLTEDAISVIEWARENLDMPYDQIFLLSQSLGTAVASTALDHYAKQHVPIQFGGLIMCAAFTCMEDAFMSFGLVKGIPLLAPLRYIPYVKTWFRRRLADQWPTREHVASILRRCDTLKLTFVHCTSDDVVPYWMTESLASLAHMTLRDLGDVEEVRRQPSDALSSTEWSSGNRVVRIITLKHGGKFMSLVII
ncbi:Alpha/Beta hydrolase protein [Xylariomycetidae sp. FL2044]|nr:Alpha/Beta hydrolase protein [Xylariomycetidae sp. FL2044]